VLQDTDAPPERMLEVLMAHGAAQRMAGELGRAKETFLEAARLARQVRRHQELAQAALGAGMAFEAGRGRAVERARRGGLSAAGVIWLAGGTGERERGLEARLALIQDLLEGGKLEAADTEISTYEEVARELRQPAYVQFALLARGMQATFHGRFEEGAGLAQ